ncbi:EF-P 5-aminopentanol modification-associated protein YfmF [Romboutsia lituseburensis]|uniref:EF-P 5-aminopentanol modification-associated protein YfmF n=1 Tax=Romboutsia lituseburensis TaxID=1537 RepID=UPI00215ABAA8|nr:insulinase family protein [Romboutsia lituseburensis]MCR8745365.1 insulinase family protein [Romboutsia lituseburensis]
MKKDIKKINLGKDINLTLISAEKFKSNLVSIYIQRNLDRKEATKNALLPTIITSGCRKYPSLREISNKLDDLYGSSMYGDVSKRGEKQVITFKIISTNERYLDEKIFTDVIEFFNDVLNDTLVVDGGFNNEYLDIEKTNLKDRIQAKINDKSRYALERSFEEMCKGERFSISEIGYEEDLEKIDAKDLYKHYKNIIKTSPIDIVIEGDFNEEEVVNVISKNFSFERDEIIDIPRETFTKRIKDINIVEENMDITQGKLVMGYRTNIDYKDESLYYPLVVGSNVLGGGPHSKMFINIREKESLCYYIYSSVEKYKAILYISSGIEAQNYEKTVDLVKKQIEAIKQGEISSDEIENSKSALINSMKSLADSIGGMSDFYFAQTMGGTNTTIDKMIENINKVEVKDIVKSFEKIELDTIYFLRN